MCLYVKILMCIVIVDRLSSVGLLKVTDNAKTGTSYLKGVSVFTISTIRFFI